jgi:galactose-1-phosphate uridylyltransferase
LCLFPDLCPTNRIAGSFELMGESQRDFAPELAAQRLRACSDIHYLD